MINQSGHPDYDRSAQTHYFAFGGADAEFLAKVAQRQGRYTRVTIDYFPGRHVKPGIG
jgi:hypothetical protein